ncbi:HEPN domain-containing protein [Streptomyces sp. SID7909]|uniref:HEPN domain-containing protein n=1 Tax=Streptomyces sp. SID7909 TaxID=2706092 RepID=UPI0013BD0FD0|nr:HEPN domain-containing protein [Streptomyces sp. SID7909]NEC09708.1 hypothetical protein [Streptomyces sp. SID7909]
MPDRGGRLEAHRLWQGLNEEYARYVEAVNYIPAGSFRHQEDMRRYLCLRFSGFLEKVTEVILLDFIERKSGGPVQAFALNELRIPNLSPEKYAILLGKFGPEYPERFEVHLGKIHKDALFDLLDIRNKVAHGDVQGGAKLDPTRYLTLVEKIYDWLFAEFLDGTEVASDT